ncbi:hypothetical protein L0664_06130 [Octadecabacter sp. G9-8]|uniref:MarR family transcriptional regulator n=1 Tax=Octadecabacter dasysiphoniae TaxID=2909341 RepID=A0ABS9CV42_9RHOB|nr:hypothetical protein [Octadecabacter dasysiphoniae]MCF2870637.1 hypothetical protein [Octadecabacter dasysiphoniae]
MKNQKRKWIERLAVSIVRALNVSGVPQTITVLYSRLWLRPGTPWTISALAEATSLDRATVREHLRNFPADHITRTDEGYVLTPSGEHAAYRLTVRFYRALPDQDRAALKRFFSTKYAGRSPMRKQAEFFIDLDRATRRHPHSIAYRTVLTAMDLMAPNGTQWSISELVDATGYSYQAVHKVLQILVKDGMAIKSGKTFTATKKGKFKCLSMFFLTVRRADMRMLRLLFEMLVFHDPPLK